MDDRITAPQLDRLYDILHQRLSPERVAHALGAAMTAVRLAHAWDADAADALIAGLLHDIAKETDLNAWRERIRQAADTDADYCPDDAEIPATRHATAASVIAREEFAISSPDVLRAIRLHPTGDTEMSRLATIIFLADYIEPSRSYAGSREIRDLARCDLQAAADATIRAKTDYVRARGRRLHARSLNALQAAERRARQGVKPT